MFFFVCFFTCNKLITFKYDIQVASWKLLNGIKTLRFNLTQKSKNANITNNSETNSSKNSSSIKKDWSGLLQIVSCECTTARVGGARPSTIEAWQSFLLNIRNYLKEWLLCSCCPSLSPSLLIEPWDVEYVSAVLFWIFCYVVCEKIKK